MSEDRLFVVAPAEDGERIDLVLVGRFSGRSRTEVQAAIHAGAVRAGRRRVRPSYRVREGEEVRLDAGWLEGQASDPAAGPNRPPGSGPQTDAPPAPSAAPELPLRLLYVDDTILVVDKPAGQVVHPAVGHAADTLVNAIVARFPDVAATEEGVRPGLVHRLDRDTSGLMVVARRRDAADHLRRQFKRRAVRKAYIAVVKGSLGPPEGIIEAPIGRHPRHRQRMAALPSGRDARTQYRVLRESNGYSLVEARPETGRTHQIRVHFAAVGHPVAGDKVYGRRDPHFPRTALHAWRLAFEHPATSQLVEFEAPLPADLTEALSRIGIRWEDVSATLDR